MSRIARAYRATRVACTRVARRWRRHQPLNLAAQIAFYFVLATQPFVITCTALLAYLPVDAESATTELIARALPGEGGARLVAIVHEVFSRRQPQLLSIAIVAAVWTASSGTSAAIAATVRARDIRDRRPFWRIRLAAIVLTIAFIALTALGGALAGGGADVGAWALGWIHHDTPRWRRLLEVLGGFFLLTTGVHLLYHFGPPRRERRERSALPGAVVAVLIAVLASRLLSTYVHHVRDLNAIYGSLAAIVLLSTWFYVSGFALVVGAEINAMLDRRARRRSPRPTATAPAEEPVRVLRSA